MPGSHGSVTRPGGRDWMAGLLLGALAGAVFLGAGGRVAMRGVAILQEWTLSFSVDGSTTVVLMGSLAGVVGAALHLGLQSIPGLPGKAQLLLFWFAAAVFTARILQPIDRDRLVMFTPVVLVYGVVQLGGLRRWMGRASRPGMHELRGVEVVPPR